MKKYLVVFLIIIFTKSSGQSTSVPIQGISVFKLGDSIDSLNSYGYYFHEIVLEEDFNYSNKYQTLDSEKNFCDNSRVFYCEKVQIDEFEFSQGATLTYFNNKLIDIRLHDILIDNNISDVLKLKYGKNYKKIFLIGYMYNINKYKAKGVHITPAIDKQLQELYLSSIYWTNGNNTISVGGSNKTYDFCTMSYKSPNLAEGGIAVTNNKEYEKLIACSNSGYLSKLKQHLNELKQKTKSF